MPRLNSLMWVCSLFVLLIVGSIYAAEPNLDLLYGAEANPTGEPLGGGPGYSKMITTGDFQVSTKEALLDALKTANPGQIIYLLPDAEIDLSGLEEVDIPAGITIAGNRGVDNAPGPMIFSNQLRTYPLFNISGANVRITGIRLRGPSPAEPDSIAMRVRGYHVEVDNCEIYNWSYAGIAMLYALDAHIHHNHIHNVRRPGLGYPVVFDSATGLVEANIFDYYRHAIAATGTLGTGYEARYNLVYGNAISHAFDMHGGTDYCPKQGMNCSEQDIFMAGNYVNIHHNTFYITTYDAIRIRGVARDYVDIHHNWFMATDPYRAVRFYYYHGGNAHVYNNIYGSTKRLIAEGIQPTPFILTIGENIVKGLANPNLISFGIDPTTLSAEPLGGTTHIGIQPIQIDPTLTGEVSLRQVRILLNDRTIYQGEDRPASGFITINSSELSDGAHNLTIMIDLSPGFTITQNRTLYVKNRWSFQDNLTPPTSSGWFGMIDNARTSATSSGWTYATDHPELFYDDSDRRVRSEATSQYLIWETPMLQEVKAIVYCRTAKTEDIHLETSVDQQTWSSVTPQVTVVGPNSAGWYQLVLIGSPTHTNAQWFRFTLNGDATTDSIQLGEIQFSGRM
jgi:pectate lyase